MNELTQDIKLGETTLDQAIFRLYDLHNSLELEDEEQRYFYEQTENILFLLIQERGRILSLTETQRKLK